MENTTHRVENDMPDAKHVVIDEPIAMVPGKISLQKPETVPTSDQALWVAIRNRTKAISFGRYTAMIDDILGGADAQLKSTLEKAADDTSNFVKGIGNKANSLISGACPSIHGTHAYNVLKLATQIFLMLEAGLVAKGEKGVELLDPQFLNAEEEKERYGTEVTQEQISEQLMSYFAINTNGPPALPYLKRIMEVLFGKDTENWKERLPYCAAVLKHRFTCPSMIELIWSYWHEEGMLTQTMNAISLRFQNRRSSLRDPLAQLEIDPLRPLNNLLWGFIQDEYNRLTVARRAYEYDHHYGLTLVGRAVPGRLDSADRRSKFLESFHNLLYRCSNFYREDADTTVISDGFPLLNALKEAHLVLAEGAHNQFGDLPWTARVEMLIQQWLLARTEMRDFLRGRIMVPYQEPWMGAVDAMKKLQGWTDTSISHFNELALLGEQILLSVRYGDWVNINNTQEQAKNWARFLKNEVQRYIHSYQVVSGVDLSADVSDARSAGVRYLQPSEHLRSRLQTQTSSGLLSGVPSAEKVLIRS